MCSQHKNHWENVYKTKNENEVSWFQETPHKSIDLIKSINIDFSSNIIDVGAGDSRLVDNLLLLGFKNITVLDISSKSIEKAKIRLGEKSDLISWVVSDINEFKSEKKFDLWHDRAAFHFLRSTKKIKSYVKLVNELINNQGTLIISTFSKNGPLKCSGLEVSQYDRKGISELFKNFKLNKSEIYIHKTPFNTNQEFIYNVLSKN
ncbi:MAG: methyltransferase domain-containing protein [Flavobacteriaceae bacterium]|nr:methyltransferase domain-containing protein [Flavobacteriaceae bacterium]